VLFVNVLLKQGERCPYFGSNVAKTLLDLHATSAGLDKECDDVGPDKVLGDLGRTDGETVVGFKSPCYLPEDGVHGGWS
jgi:hypothetical protein